ncbi:MAG: hydroxymethylglutaryl-CoA lyase [Bacteroidia bacterium]|nr:hydroxymethylglutaryl-CoA lyase [Bacteroidia bacterium]
MNSVQLIECPRDAMQGITAFIPTELKIKYHQSLLKVGFHTIDIGSYVSPKSIPQMQDTDFILHNIGEEKGNTQLLVIVANKRGADSACQNPYVDYIGFPFSVSETFQQRNTNQNLTQAFELVQEIQSLCKRHQKKLVIYLSMAFGNPYGEKWDTDITLAWALRMQTLGIEVISFADTVGTASTFDIAKTFTAVSTLAGPTWGAHLHSNPNTWQEKIAAAWEAGCRRFDGAIGGFGGCPFAKDELVGNIATENLYSFITSKVPDFKLNTHELQKSIEISHNVFQHH